MSELAKIETIKAVEVYNNGKMDGLLTKLEAEVLSFIPVLDTDKGRKEIASLAYKVRRSKTFLDGLGENLIEDSRNRVKAVNSERKIMRDRLDLLAEKAREPLTKFEDAEKLRLENIDAEISGLSVYSISEDLNGDPLTSSFMKENLTILKAIKIDGSFGEKSVEAAQIKDREVLLLGSLILKTEKQEHDTAELDRLRKEKEEKEEEERLEKIRREGEEREKLKAEKLAIEEKERVATEKAELAKKNQARLDENEKERLDEIARLNGIAEQKEKDRLTEIDRLKKEAEAAEQKSLNDIKAVKDKAEADRLEGIRKQKQKEADLLIEKQAAELLEEKRQSDTEHRSKVNRNILSAFSVLGIDEKAGKNIITEIVHGHIPNVSIKY